MAGPGRIYAKKQAGLRIAQLAATLWARRGGIVACRARRDAVAGFAGTGKNLPGMPSAGCNGGGGAFVYAVRGR